MTDGIRVGASSELAMFGIFVLLWFAGWLRAHRWGAVTPQKKLAAFCALKKGGGGARTQMHSYAHTQMHTDTQTHTDAHRTHTDAFCA